MNLLIIDSSTALSSVALLANNKITTIVDTQEHTASETLLVNIDQLLSAAHIKLADISALAFTTGPGSFTGVRISASIAQGLAFGADLPLIAISSLELIAEQARQEHGVTQVLVALDARMNEVYTGYFEINQQWGCMQLVGQLEVIAPKNLEIPENIYLAGNGFTVYLQKKVAIEVPRAEYGIELAIKKYQNKDFIALDMAVPVYVRDKII